MDDWQPIETAPKDKWILAWFISVNPENTAAHMATIAQVSSYEEGMVWDGGKYLSLGCYTHWMPLPSPPQ